MASFKLLIAALLLPTIVSSLPSQTPIAPPIPRLSFRPGPDGTSTFKLTVFSDLHFGENATLDSQSVSLMDRLCREERPDFVVINGDLVTGERISHETTINELLPQLLGPVIRSGTPFATTGGNHDNQQPITRLDMILAEKAYGGLLSYTQIQSDTLPNPSVHGPGNYWVPVYAHETSLVPSLILWFFDSRGGMDKDGKVVEDFVHPNVAKWIQKQHNVMERLWGKDKLQKTMALAFVHIPPNDIQNSHPDPERNPGLNDNQLGPGAVQDGSNSSKDAPFWDAVTSPKLIPNLKAIVSGHVHGNEWCIREKKKDVIFCFSKHTGFGGYDSPAWLHGVRNFVFSSPDPSAPVSTWIKLETGEERAKISLDDHYLR